MTLHHAYLIKGWLLDKDPPKEITEAVEAIIAAADHEIAQDVRAITRIDDELLKLRDDAGKIVDRQANS